MKNLLNPATKTYANPYERAYDLYKYSPHFSKEYWDSSEKNGSLDQYVATLQQSDKITNIEQFKKDYKLDFSTPETYVLALQNEIFKDSLSSKFTNGVETSQGTPISDYDYYKMAIAETNIKAEYDYNKAIFDESKESKSWLEKVAGGAAATLSELGAGIAQGANDILEVVGGAAEAATLSIRTNTSFAENFGEVLSSDRYAAFKPIEQSLINFEKNYYIRDYDGNFTSNGKIIGGALNSIGKMIPSALLPGGKVVKHVGFYVSSEFGQSYEEKYKKAKAENLNIDYTQMMFAQAGISAAKYATEIVLEKLIGGGGGYFENKLFGIGSNNGVIDKLLPQNMSAITRFVLRQTGDALEEGVEEVVQDCIEVCIDDMMGGDYAKLSELDGHELVTTFLIASLSSVIGNSFGTSVELIKNRNTPVFVKDRNLKGIEKLQYFYDYRAAFDAVDKAKRHVENLNRADVAQDVSEKSYKAAYKCLYRAYTLTKVITDLYGSLGETSANRVKAALDRMSELCTSKKYSADAIQTTYNSVRNALENTPAEYLKSVLHEVELKAMAGYVKNIVNEEQVNDLEFSQEKQSKIKSVLNRFKIKSVAIVEEGNDVIATTDNDGNTIAVIPEQTLELSDEDVILNIVNAQILSSITSNTNFKQELNTVTKLYAKYSGIKHPTSKAVSALLYDSKFFEACVFVANEDTFKLYTSLVKMLSTLNATEVKDAIYKTKLQAIVNNMTKSLVEYCKVQPNADISFLTDQTLKNEIAAARYGDNVFYRVFSHKLTETDKQWLKVRINTLAVSRARKLEIFENLLSTDAMVNTNAVNTLRSLMQYQFASAKYNGKIYMPRTNIANFKFNEWAEANGFTIANLSTKSLSKSEMELAQSLSSELTKNDAMFTVRKLLFEDYTNNMYTFAKITTDTGTSFGIFEKSTGLQVGVDKVLATADIARVKDMNLLTTSTVSYNKILDKWISSELDVFTRASLTLSDIIENPRLLNNEIRENIKSEYKLTADAYITSYHAYNYLRKYLMTNNKNLSIQITSDGTYVFGNYAQASKVRNKRSIKLSADVNVIYLRDIIKSQFLPGWLKDTVIVVDDSQLPANADAQFSSYRTVPSGTTTAMSNAIYVRSTLVSNPIDLENKILHEYQHALHEYNALNFGFDPSWLITELEGKGMTVDNVIQIVKDVAEHTSDFISDEELALLTKANLASFTKKHKKPTTAEDAMRAVELQSVQMNIRALLNKVGDFIYYCSGETSSYGMDSVMAFDYYPVVVNNGNITFPWGTSYSFDGNVVHAKSIKNTKDTAQSTNIEEVVTLSDDESLNIVKSFSANELIDKRLANIEQLENTSESVKNLMNKTFAIAKALGLQYKYYTQNIIDNTNGFYVDKVIYISNDIHPVEYNSDADEINVLFHETLHAVTKYAIDIALLRIPYDTTIGASKVDFDNIKALGLSLISIYQELSTKYYALVDDVYGLTDVYEMVAELANPDFRAFLKTKSLWQRLIDAICKFIGITSTHNAYDVTFHTVEKLVDSFDESVWNYHDTYGDDTALYYKRIESHRPASKATNDNSNNIPAGMKYTKLDKDGNVVSSQDKTSKTTEQSTDTTNNESNTQRKRHKRTVHTTTKFGTDKNFYRYVSKKSAGDTNLKYYVGAQLNEQFQNFLRKSADKTKYTEDIKNRNLTSRKLEYDMYSGKITDAKTFKLMNDTYYKNANIKTSKDLEELITAARSYWVLYKISKQHSLDIDLTDIDISAATELVKAIFLEETADAKSHHFDRLYTKLQNEFERSDPDLSAKYMRMLFMQNFDGTLNSAGRIVALAKRMADLHYQTTATEQRASTSLDATISGRTKSGHGGEDSSTALGDLIQSDMDLEDMVINKISYNEKAQVLQELLVKSMAKKLYNKPVNELTRNEAIALIKESTRRLSKLTNAEIDNLYLKYALRNKVTKTAIEPPVEKFEHEETGAMIYEAKHTKDKLVENIQYNASTIRIKLKALTPSARKRFLEKASKYFKDDLTIKDNWLYKLDKHGKRIKEGRAFVRADLEVLEEAYTFVKDVLESVRHGDFNKQSRFDAIEKLKDTVAKYEQQAKKVKETGKGKIGSVYINTVKATDRKYSDRSVTIQSTRQVPSIITKLLQYNMGKMADTNIKYLSDDNEKHMVVAFKNMIRDNAKDLQNLSEAEILEIVEFITDGSVLTSVGDAIRYQSVVIMLGTYILAQYRDGTYNLPSEMITKLKNIVKSTISLGATIPNTWHSAMQVLVPNAEIHAKALANDDVHLSDAQIQRLERGYKTNNAQEVERITKEIYSEIEQSRETALQEYRTKLINEKRELENLKHALGVDNSKKIAAKEKEIKSIERAIAARSSDRTSIFDKILKLQRQFMLSSPGTWIRNHLSNLFIGGVKKKDGTVVIPGVNIISEWVASKVLSKDVLVGKAKSQWKIIGTKVSTDAKNFIQTNIIDSHFIDLIGTGLSKSNLEQYKIYGNTSANAIADMITDKLARDLFNKNHKLAGFLNNMLSDDPYIKRDVLRYFGKILTESNVDLTRGFNDSIADLFVEAYSLAAQDYMHKSNFVHKFEKILREKGETYYFMYKQLFPFAASSINWFAEGLKLTPIGLAKSIYNFATLEKRYDKMADAYTRGESSINEKFAEYISKRDIAKGILGSIGTLAGILLAVAGKAGIDEEDDKYKLIVGDVAVDISPLFGTSGILVGISFVQSFKDNSAKGWLDNFLTACESMLNTAFEDSLYSDLINLVRRSEEGVGSLLTQYLTYTLPSMFVPSMLKTVTSITKKNNVIYDSGVLGSFEKIAVSAVPFLDRVFPHYYDPYTGENQVTYRSQLLTNIFNKLGAIKIYPYNISELEMEARSVGVKRGPLTGRYTINDEDYSLTTSDKATVNEYYGNLNKNSLTKLYQSRTKYRVLKDDKSGYEMLYYNQMSSWQKNNVIENIMSNNATISKIYILTSTNAYKYYCDKNEYKKLKEARISKNIYVSNKKKGFEKIK